MEVRKYLAVMLVGMMVVSGLGIVSVGMNTVTPRTNRQYWSSLKRQFPECRW
jgi:hypothetical protein